MQIDDRRAKMIKNFKKICHFVKMELQILQYLSHYREQQCLAEMKHLEILLVRYLLVEILFLYQNRVVIITF